MKITGSKSHTVFDTDTVGGTVLHLGVMSQVLIFGAMEFCK